MLGFIVGLNILEKNVHISSQNNALLCTICNVLKNNCFLPKNIHVYTWLQNIFPYTWNMLGIEVSYPPVMLVYFVVIDCSLHNGKN